MRSDFRSAQLFFLALPIFTAACGGGGGTGGVQPPPPTPDFSIALRSASRKAPAVVTTSGLSIVQLADVPLGIGTLSPSSGPAAGGTTVTLRGSGSQSGIAATLGGKTASVSLTDMNTLILTTPVLVAGPQQLVLTNPDGESVVPDSAFSAQ